jgi:hypothetical protein
MHRPQDELCVFLNSTLAQIGATIAPGDAVVACKIATVRATLQAQHGAWFTQHAHFTCSSVSAQQLAQCMLCCLASWPV